MANANVSIRKEKINVLDLAAPAATTQGDLLIIGPFVGVALNTALNGAELSVDIEDGVECDVVSAVSGVGAAIGDAVYYNPTTGAFSAVMASGYYKVGHVTVVRDSANCFRFAKLRRHLMDLKFAELADTDALAPTNNDTLKYVTSTTKWTVVAQTD